MSPPSPPHSYPFLPSIMSTNPIPKLYFPRVPDDDSDGLNAKSKDFQFLSPSFSGDEKGAKSEQRERLCLSAATNDEKRLEKF